MPTKQEIREYIGHRVRVRRVDCRLKLQELAPMVGMSYQLLGAVERGERGLRVDQLIPLSRALNCTPSDLLGEYDKKDAA